MTLPPEIVEDPRWRRLAETRERDAAAARAAQRSYLRLTTTTIVSTAAAAILGGLVLYGVETDPAPDHRLLVRLLADGHLRTGLVVVQGLCLAAAAAGGALLGARDPRTRWVEARLRAEDGRLRLAERALRLGHERGPEAFRAAGDWFESFVESQRGHLRRSADRRDRAARRLALAAALLAGLGALAAALTGLQAGLIVVAVAIFGVSAPALVSAVQSLGRERADARRAKLHERSWRALTALLERTPEFRASVAAADLEGALAYAEAVFDVLRRDHAGFAAAHEGEEIG